MNLYRLLYYLNLMRITDIPVMKPGKRGGYVNIAYNDRDRAIVVDARGNLRTDKMIVEWRREDDERPDAT